MLASSLYRRDFLKIVWGGFLSALLSKLAFAAETKETTNDQATIGAIRWDAWYDPDDGAVAQAVEKSLTPQEFHHRMPFFGKVTGPDSVRINGNFQNIMDQEILSATEAGIDYWAFCSYTRDNPLSNALKLYLSSKHRHKIKFCLIASLEAKTDYFKTQTDYQIEMMLEPGYMTVLGNRPLFYLLGVSDAQMTADGGAEKLAAWITYIREQMQKHGRGNPYFVLSEHDPQRAYNISKMLNIDALGKYATPLGPFGGAPYSVLVKYTEAYWDALTQTGLPVVPNIMTGWDMRPILKSPLPWQPNDKTLPQDHYYKEGTPMEIANHIEAAIQWIKQHPKAAEANTALMYAWNECAEGFGAMVPSFDPENISGNNSRIKAMAETLRKIKLKDH